MEKIKLKRKNIGNLILITVAVFSFLSIFITNIYFAAERSLEETNLNSGAKLDLQEIRIPLFRSIIDFNSNTATIWSWLSFAGSLATVGLIIYWIVLLVRTGVEAMRSSGDQAKLAEAGKKVQAIFIGAAITFLIPAALSIIGSAIGIGNIFQWPKMFSQCTTAVNGKKYEFYFQAFLANGNNEERAAAACPQK